MLIFLKLLSSLENIKYPLGYFEVLILSHRRRRLSIKPCLAIDTTEIAVCQMRPTGMFGAAEWRPGSFLPRQIMQKAFSTLAGLVNDEFINQFMRTVKARIFEKKTTQLAPLF
jgi:hypothetical protein